MEGYISQNQWIDLSTLSRRVSDGHIDWAKSVGATMKFRYHNIDGCAIIVDNFPKECRVSIYIDGYTNKNGYKISRDSILNCRLGTVLRDKIATSRPDLVQYLANKNDAFVYSQHSGEYIVAKCPLCEYEKQYRVTDLARYGFSCNRCGDGISYPNKFMLCLLEQLNLDFIPEISRKTSGFEWLNLYRYDFYVYANNQHILIEMDGAIGHGNKKFKSNQRDVVGLQIDHLKDASAQLHGMKVIRIDCDYGHEDRFSFIKNNIIKSDFFDVLGVENNIDWNLCNKRGLSSFVTEACNYWKSGIKNTTKIANLMHISRTTARKYLKIGASIGWCDYVAEEARKATSVLCGEKLKKFQEKCVAVYLNGELINIFKSAIELERRSLEVFGVKISQSTVSCHCRNLLNKTRNGYTMRFITRDEYEQLSPQFQAIQNECNNLQEVI